MSNSKTGGPSLGYWRDYYVPRYFPKGSRIFAATSSLPGVEVLAAKPPGSKNLRVLLINRQVAHKKDVDGKGVPATVELQLSHFPGVKKITVRHLDAATPVDSGPPASALPVSGAVKVALPGYGVALLEFSL
jgi:hypothetical protein